MPDQLTAARTAQGPARSSMGERVRQLRIARGLTQTELAGERFSKEYVSQIERGKTRPTGDTVEWLASRLGVDPSFLETGVSSSERERVESVVVRAEAALESNQYEETVSEIDKLGVALTTIAVPALEFRALLAESWARMSLGDVRAAIGLLDRARQLTESPTFSDVDRAEVLYRLGVCRYKLSSIATAVALFSESLDLAERSGLPADRLRSNAFGWRSRCYRRQRDWEAAREDVERALELAESLNDRRTVAHHYFQASLIAERTGHWVLARSYAERAKAQYEELADQANVGKLLNNLGGLNFQLGKPQEAIKHLRTPTGFFSRSAMTQMPATSSRRSRRFTYARVSRSSRRSRRGTHLSFWTAASTTSTRSGTPSSSSAGPSSSRSASTRRTRRSRRRRPASNSCPPSATGPLPGSPKAIWRCGAAKTAERRISTAARPRHYRTSASNERR
jgi:transcriptional regulator with XRE-family HTH domain